MSWDNLFYPNRADKNDDGKVDFWEQSEADYEYDAVMGTNISGAFPEHENKSFSDEEDDDYIDRLLYGDAEDLFDDDYTDSSDFDEDESEEDAEDYSTDLDLEEIIKANYNGYYTSDGEYHRWKIKDMLDSYDDIGFWDKCGYYHVYDEISDNITDSKDNNIYISEKINPLAHSKKIETDDSIKEFSEDELYTLIYDKFPEIGNFYSKKEFKKDPSILYCIYPKNRSFVLTCWDWVMQTYSETFLKNPEFRYACNIFLKLIPDVAYYKDAEMGEGIFAKHLIDNPDFIETLFLKCPYDSENYSLYQFLSWCIIMDDLDTFKKVYGMILSNKNYIEEPPEKAYIIEKILFYLSEFTDTSAPARFYEYLKAEIKSVPRKGRIASLLEKLDNGYFGFPQFFKPGDNNNSESDTFYSEESLSYEATSFSDNSEESSDLREITFSDTVAGRIYSKAYEKFPEMANYITPSTLEENFHEFLNVYIKDRPLATDFWAWIIENYVDELNTNSREYRIMLEDYFELIPKDMFICDGKDRNKFFQHYLAERPVLLEILFSKQPYNLTSRIPGQFLAWSVIRNDFASFEKVYEMILNNKKYVYQPPKKELIIEDTLYWLKSFAKTSSGEKFYVFLKKEIETVTDSIKKNELLNVLEEKIDGKDFFIKPKDPKRYEKDFKAEYNIFEASTQVVIPPKIALTKKSDASTSIPILNVTNTAETIGNDSVLNELLDRKRVLESMLKEVNDKIAELRISSNPYKTTPQKENDEFFNEAGVAGIKYCDSKAICDIQPDAKLNLVREPENQYDKNAVSVYDQHDRKIGYLTKQTNIPISSAMDSGKHLYAKVDTLPKYERYPNMKIEIWESK